ncbi:MAG: hypothetical protein CM1200mP30_26790 [Pseudomonadota bacterium]|nr:MAG: hypothetical protein CM1200mP30_26790 [Pseudomonadota bacterium]
MDLLSQGKGFYSMVLKFIPQNATCKDSKGNGPVGNGPWETLENKLDSGPVHCTLISDLQNPKGESRTGKLPAKKRKSQHLAC